MLFQLRPDLGRHELGPRIFWQVKILNKRARKDFRRYQVFMQVPDEAISNPMRICFELYADRNQVG